MQGLAQIQELVCQYVSSQLNWYTSELPESHLQNRYQKYNLLKKALMIYESLLLLFFVYQISREYFNQGQDSDKVRKNFSYRPHNKKCEHVV